MDVCLVPLVLSQLHKASPAVLRQGQEHRAASCHLSNLVALYKHTSHQR